MTTPAEAVVQMLSRFRVPGELADVGFLTGHTGRSRHWCRRGRSLLRWCRLCSGLRRSLIRGRSCLRLDEGWNSQQRNRREVHPLQAMFVCAHGGLQSSENKIKAQKQAAAGNVRAVDRRYASLSQNGILVVERETRAAGNKWIVAVAEGQHIHIAKISGQAW